MIHFPGRFAGPPRRRSTITGDGAPGHALGEPSRPTARVVTALCEPSRAAARVVTALGAASGGGNSGPRGAGTTGC